MVSTMTNALLVKVIGKMIVKANACTFSASPASIPISTALQDTAAANTITSSVPSRNPSTPR